MKTLPEQIGNMIPSYLSTNDKKRWATTNKEHAEWIGKMLAIPSMRANEKLAALAQPANRALFDKEELVAILGTVHNNTLLLHFMQDLSPGGWLVKALEELIETRIATLTYQRNIKQLLIDHYFHYLQQDHSKILRLLGKIQSREVLSRLVAFLLRQDFPLQAESLVSRVNVLTRELLLQKNK